MRRKSLLRPTKARSVMATAMLAGGVQGSSNCGAHVARPATPLRLATRNEEQGRFSRRSLRF